MLNIVGNDSWHLPPPRVLVVEDDAMHRDVIKTLLPSPSYFVDFARDGSEGLEMALTRSYDVVLTDLRMPKMTGDEMVDNLRRYPHLLGHCQIAVMSTVPYDVAGVSAYLQKPFRGAELKKLINEQAFIAYEAKKRHAYAVVRSSNITVDYDNVGMPRLVWGRAEEHFGPDVRLLRESAMKREQKEWRILLGYKDQAESSALAIFLRAHGFKVQLATSDAEFSSYANAGFHLILIDHCIGEATVRLARTKSTAKTWAPILMLSASSLQAEHVDFLLVKPIDSGALVGTLSIVAKMESERRGITQSTYSKVAEFGRRSVS